MYTPRIKTGTKLSINQTYYAESLIHKIRRIVNNKEPISDGAPQIYTERKDGVRPEYDIRTDRFEHAIEAMDHVAKSHTAKREMRIGEKTYDTMKPEQQKAFNEKFPNNKHAKAAAAAASKGEGGA